MNYNNYPPSGIDAKIKMIQNALNGHLGFQGVDFYGRVQKTLSKELNLLVPEFYFDFPNKREVFYDSKNAPGGNVFFIDSDNHTSKNGNQFTAKVKIVFMLNLEKIFEQNKSYRADSEVQEHCLKLVKKIRGLSSDIELEKGLENVLKGFDVKKIKLNDMQPYHIFSINGDLNYSFNCERSLSSIGNSNSGGEVVEPEPECTKPVINQFPSFQFGERAIQKGVTSYLQIEATNNPTEYSLHIPFITDAQGINVNENGLITINYNGVAEVILLNYSASNACGRTDKAIYLRLVNHDVNLLLPPTNLVAGDFNPEGMPGSFMLTSTFLAYSGTITNVEYHINGSLYKNFFGTLLNNFLGFNGNRMDGLVKGDTYDVKIRVKNSLGQYSDFSETLTVTIPN